MKVLATPSEWKKFVRRAKSHYPKEAVAALWGVETIDSFRISVFNRMRVTDAGKFYISYDDEEIDRQRQLAHKNGLTFLGTIHTHPHVDCDPAPSGTDHADGIKKGERLMGIIHIWKDKKTGRFTQDVGWWFPQSRIPFELLPE